MAGKEKEYPFDDDQNGEKRYRQSKDVYASITQAFQAVKEDKVGLKSWNCPVEELKGCTISLLGDNKVRLSYHKIVTGLPQEIMKAEPEMKKLTSQLSTELKKKYKKLTKETLTLKKIKEDKVVEKYSRLYADSSWALGGAAAGHAVGRWYVTYQIVYEFS